MSRFKRGSLKPKFKRKHTQLPSDVKNPSSKNTMAPARLAKNNNGGNGNGNGNAWLTPNQKVFADEWLIDRNGTRAYKIAYPNVKKDETAGVCAYELLRLPKIAAYVEKRLKEIAKKTEIDSQWVLERYKMLTDYCIDDFFYDDGSMKPFSEIPRDKLYAIGGFKQSKRTLTTKDKVLITNAIKEFDLPKKKDVLDSIGKYLGMFERDNEQRRPNVNQPIQINVTLET